MTIWLNQAIGIPMYTVNALFLPNAYVRGRNRENTVHIGKRSTLRAQVNQQGEKCYKVPVWRRVARGG